VSDCTNESSTKRRCGGGRIRLEPHVVQILDRSFESDPHPCAQVNARTADARATPAAASPPCVARGVGHEAWARLTDRTRPLRPRGTLDAYR
jgi:hypothetical protein